MRDLLQQQRQQREEVEMASLLQANRPALALPAPTVVAQPTVSYPASQAGSFFTTSGRHVGAVTAAQRMAQANAGPAIELG